VQAADYDGGLEEGYVATVAALAGLADDVAPGSHPDPDIITVLIGAHLTPGDAVWLRDTCEDVGLRPVLLPDAGALDGSRQGLSPLATGGTSLADIRSLGRSSHTVVIGASLEGVARSLHNRFGTPYTVLDSAHGLAASDLLLATLSLLSGSPVPVRFERQRRVLVDAMRDAQLELAGSRITLALEPDHALSIAGLLTEVAAHVAAVVPTGPPHAVRIPAEEVVVGDFASVPGSTELLIAGSHGQRTAAILGAAHLEAGFPVFASYGASRTVSLGYAGATALVDAAANALAARKRAHHPSVPAPAPAPEPVPTTKGGVR
jgi:nitrogenase molybdenum-iron protein NifN